MSFPNKKPYSPPMSNVAYTNVANNFSVAQVVLGSTVLTQATGAPASSQYAMKNASNTFNQQQVINSPGVVAPYNYALALNNGLLVAGDSDLQAVSASNIHVGVAGVIQIDGVNVVTTTTGDAAYAPIVNPGFGAHNYASVYSSPVGSMVIWPGVPGSVTPAVPVGWLLCNGASTDEFTYPDLFEVLGYTYGGGPGFGFNVPNMNGVLPMGSTAVNSNHADGQSSTYLAVNNIPYMPLVTGIDSAHQPLCPASLIPSGNGSSNIVPTGFAGTYNTLTSGSPLQIGNLKAYVGSPPGAQQSFSNIPPVIWFNYIIYAGV